MKNCEICNKNQATVHFKQLFDGTVREIHVCEECAAEKGFDTHLPESLTDLLFGLNNQQKAQEKAADERVCPSCKLSLSDFKKASRLGCPACYETFAQDLAPVIAGMQKGITAHKGKVPAGARVSAELARLNQLLKEAVAAQNFEEAARLRDQIRAAKHTPEAVQPAGRD